MDFMTWLRAEWDRVAGYTLIVLGAAALLFGYRGVSNSPYVAEELAFIISGGLGGMFLLGTGATLLISADLHDEWRKLDRIEAAIRGEPPRGDGRGSSNGHRPTDRSNEPIAEEPTGAHETAHDTAHQTEGLPAMAPRSRIPAGRMAGIPMVFRRAVAVSCAGLLAAAIVLVLAWHRASNVSDPKPAVSALALAVVGLVLCGAAAMSGTLSLKRSIKQRQMHLLGRWALADLGQRLPEWQTASGGDNRNDDHNEANGNGRVLVARDLTHFHKPGCPVVDGVKVRAVRRDRVPAGLAPCDLCDDR
jgi:hypothetical protein